MTWRLWKGEEAKKRANKAAKQALTALGKEIMHEAKQQVPLRDGDLQRTGRVRRSRAKKPRVLLTFGSREVQYATRWHEKNPPGSSFRGGRKKRFLADPFNVLAGTRLKPIFAIWFRSLLGR